MAKKLNTFITRKELVTFVVMSLLAGFALGLNVGGYLIWKALQ